MAEQTPQSAQRPDTATELAFDRTRAAYERTMMAWIRTATSLITFGFTIYKFFQIEAPDRGQQNRLIGPRRHRASAFFWFLRWSRLENVLLSREIGAPSDSPELEADLLCGPCKRSPSGIDSDCHSDTALCLAGLLQSVAAEGFCWHRRH